MAPFKLFSSAKPFNLKMFLMTMGASLVLSAVGLAATWYLYLAPIQADAIKLSETVIDISNLYGLQMRYKESNKSYANDLETLLAMTPDREAFKARLARNVDMTTLAVVGDAKKFKLEANVLDRERTLVRLRGPVVDPVATAEPKMTEASGQAGGGIELGKPVATPRPR